MPDYRWVDHTEVERDQEGCTRLYVRGIYMRWTMGVGIYKEEERGCVTR